MTDDELRVRLRDRGCWYDYNDNSTWFQDDTLTVPALQPEDVRYVKNKVGPGYMKIKRIEIDNHGRHYIDYNENVKMYNYLLTDGTLPLSDMEAVEQQFMQDMKIR